MILIANRHIFGQGFRVHCHMGNMKHKLKSQWLLSWMLLLFEVHSVHCQSNVALTIDDVPNTGKYQADGFQSSLLDQLDSLRIPIAAFINESNVYNTDSLVRNFGLLIRWVSTDYITPGNHTFAHSRYSEVGYESFKQDVERGECTLRELGKKYNKPIRYFRFPYNDLGKDSIQHVKAEGLLQSMNYINAPFTIESSDWMFNRIYAYYLAHSEFDKAKEIGEMYVSKTLDYFHFFDSLSVIIVGRKVNQIYLCHDNSLNADYLFEIMKRLKEEGYRFISLDQALEDPVYKQSDLYYEKWGVSWFYRWMPVRKVRLKWMRSEPDLGPVESIYNQLD